MKLLLIIAALVAVISVADPAAGSADLEEKATQLSYTEEDTVHGRQIIPTNRSIPFEMEATTVGGGGLSGGYVYCKYDGTDVPCVIGTYSKSGLKCDSKNCAPCYYGTNSPAGSTTCCSYGLGLRLDKKTGYGYGSCLECDAGYYSNQYTGGVCLPCGTGYYSPAKRATSCTICYDSLQVGASTCYSQPPTVKPTAVPTAKPTTPQPTYGMPTINPTARPTSSIGDGKCDVGNNNRNGLYLNIPAYDGGDCCVQTCTAGRTYPCGTNGFNCRESPYYKLTPVPSRRPTIAGCKGQVTWVSDGYCDDANNNANCQFDGGDCCKQTCANAPWNGVNGVCGINGYNCKDPLGTGKPTFKPTMITV